MANDFTHHVIYTAVELRILTLRKKGGVQPEDYTWLQRVDGSTTERDWESLMTGGEEANRMFNIMTRAIAIFSFFPGGITFLGKHWEQKDMVFGKVSVNDLSQTIDR